MGGRESRIFGGLDSLIIIFSYPKRVRCKKTPSNLHKKCSKLVPPEINSEFTPEKWWLNRCQYWPRDIELIVITCNSLPKTNNSSWKIDDWIWLGSMNFLLGFGLFSGLNSLWVSGGVKTNVNINLHFRTMKVLIFQLSTQRDMSQHGNLPRKTSLTTKTCSRKYQNSRKQKCTPEPAGPLPSGRVNHRSTLARVFLWKEITACCNYLPHFPQLRHRNLRGIAPDHSRFFEGME